MDAGPPRGACHRAARCADPLAPSRNDVSELTPQLNYPTLRKKSCNGATRMSHLSNSGNDLRVFMGELEDDGELRRVNGADWNLEIGALTEIGAEQNGPALLFDDIKGYPSGFRILSNVFAGQKRTAMTLGLPRDLSGVALINAWRARLRDFKPVPPKAIKTGPIMENVVEGDAVDL